MIQFYQLDFDQVAEAGLRTRHRPTFPSDQLRHALEPAMRAHQLVKQYERYHHGHWCLPLVEAHVRAWLKRLVFTRPPVVVAGGAEVTCSKPAPPPEEQEVARWREHFLLVAGNVAYLVNRLDALEAGEREAHGKEDADRPAQVVALRRLLQREEVANG